MHYRNIAVDSVASYDYEGEMLMAAVNEWIETHPEIMARVEAAAEEQHRNGEVDQYEKASGGSAEEEADDVPK